MKFISFNVNGIKSCFSKEDRPLYNLIENEKPDVLCIQETKLQPKYEQIYMEKFEGYDAYFNSCTSKNGYSGTAMYIKSTLEPLELTYGFGIEEYDCQGRCMTLRFKNFFLINTYVCNSGQGLVRLGFRMRWDKIMMKYIMILRKLSPVIWTGDLNVIACPKLDLKNQKTSKKAAGNTEEERYGFGVYMQNSLVDVFRYFNPDKKQYTQWSYFGKARKYNRGWRLDYFLVDHELIYKVTRMEILDQVMGSDHCPIVLEIDI
jgi:exodeoxyribonuclease-3